MVVRPWRTIGLSVNCVAAPSARWKSHKPGLLRHCTPTTRSSINYAYSFPIKEPSFYRDLIAARCSDAVINTFINTFDGGGFLIIWQLGVGTAAALSVLILQETKLLTASNILFLYNKANSPPSRWHQDTCSYCSTASLLHSRRSWQQWRRRRRPPSAPLTLLVDAARVSPPCRPSACPPRSSAEFEHSFSLSFHRRCHSVHFRSPPPTGSPLG